MLEILQGTSYVLSLMFFWSGALFFDLQNRKMKQELEAQKKLQELLKNKEFIKEYMDTVKSAQDDD